MKKKAWWKKAVLLCGMMALLPFCMGICLMPTASPEPEVSQEQGGEAALVFTVPEPDSSYEGSLPKPEVPFPDTQLPEYFWELPNPQKQAPVIPVE